MGEEADERLHRVSCRVGRSNDRIPAAILGEGDEAIDEPERAKLESGGPVPHHPDRTPVAGRPPDRGRLPPLHHRRCGVEAGHAAAGAAGETMGEEVLGGIPIRARAGRISASTPPESTWIRPTGVLPKEAGLPRHRGREAPRDIEPHLTDEAPAWAQNGETSRERRLRRDLSRHSLVGDPCELGALHTARGIVRDGAREEPVEPLHRHKRAIEIKYGHIHGQVATVRVFR